MITIHRGDVSIIPYGPMDESQLSKVRGRGLWGWEEWMGHRVFDWLMIIVQHKVIRFLNVLDVVAIWSVHGKYIVDKWLNCWYVFICIYIGIINNVNIGSTDGWLIYIWLHKDAMVHVVYWILWDYVGCHPWKSWMGTGYSNTGGGCCSAANQKNRVQGYQLNKIWNYDIIGLY